MNKDNHRRNDIWVKEDEKVKTLEKTLKIPPRTLRNVPFVDITNKSDLKKIPNKGGCYWIWTNEPVRHSFHKHVTPKQYKIGSLLGEIIYNGIAKDDIRGRIEKHLFGKMSDGWSGISLDILLDHPPVSHRKKALSKNPRYKTPYINGIKIRTKKQLLNLFLSNKEKKFIKDPKIDEFYFRNGINRLEQKHVSYKFRVYFIVGLTSVSYLEFVEKRWREKFNIPKLCSYQSGR